MREETCGAMANVSACVSKERWRFLVLIGDCTVSPMLMDLCLQEAFTPNYDAGEASNASYRGEKVPGAGDGK